jgi:hypothetical protein
MLRQELFTKPRPYDTKFRRNIARFRGISRNFAKVFSCFAKFRRLLEFHKIFVVCDYRLWRHWNWYRQTWWSIWFPELMKWRILLNSCPLDQTIPTSRWSWLGYQLIAYPDGSIHPYSYIYFDNVIFMTYCSWTEKFYCACGAIDTAYTIKFSNNC